MKTLLALVLSQHVVETPDQPWALETIVSVQTAEGLRELRLPGGQLGEVRVDVSHTPYLVEGGRYQLDVAPGSGLSVIKRGEWVGGLVPPPYAVSGSEWPVGVIDVDFMLSAESWPSEVDRDALEAATTEVLRIWNRDGRSNIEMVYGGRTTSTQYGSGSDGSNTVLYEDYDFGSTLAVSVRTTVGGEIRDCDVRFYGSNSNGAIDWNLDPSGAPDGENALRHTLLHEFGHCLGLSHSADPEAQMYRYAPDDQDPSSWVLHPDDVAGLQSIYGVASPGLAVSLVDVDAQALTVAVENTGDWTAFEVGALLTAEGPLQSASDPFLGDLRSAAVAELVVPLQGDCGATQGSLRVFDAFDASAELELGEFGTLCDGEDPAGFDETPAVGCGCRSSGGAGWLLLLPLLAVRRRQ